MTTFEIIKADVEQCQESLVQRSDVYNSKRVIIKAQKYRGILSVYIQDLPAREFSLNIDSLEVANYIQDKTI